MKKYVYVFFTYYGCKAALGLRKGLSKVFDKGWYILIISAVEPIDNEHRTGACSNHGLNLSSKLPPGLMENVIWVIWQMFGAF